MWTPKRLFLLLSGFGAFIAVYAVYAFWLGGIDGLPPLPADYGPQGNVVEPIGDNLRLMPEAERKLEQAFGPSWKEDLKCDIKLEVRERNLVLATKDYIFEKDGRVRLTPFNIAIFGKEESGRAPEINTVRSETAYLTFDKPVKNLAEMSKHKIVAGELVGDIRIRNNRRTPNVSRDDVSLMTQGPLYYLEDRHLIHTPAPVRIVDEQTKPEQSTIEAIGMQINLCSDADVKPATGKPAAAQKRNQSISGVESIHLLSSVDMHLWVESSGFLGGNGEAAPAGEAPPDIPMLHITTQGKFHYVVSPDEEKAPDRAVFELPEKPGQLPERVTVTRIAGPKAQEKRDQLFCDRLELSFRRKADAPAAQPQPGGSVNLAIQDAHATGQLVELHSDTDVLDAAGNDFFYDARTKQSTLRGNPRMVALKDGHEITAQELQIDTGQRDLRQAKARGPGRINMLDKDKGTRHLHAGWTESLDFTKDGAFDCLTLKGNAVFEDTESQQKLQADTLRVWLQPAEKNAPTGPEPQKPRPHHVKATGHVRAASADLLIHDPTEDLTIWFKDVPSKPAAAETPAAPKATAIAGAGAPPAATPAPPASGKPSTPEPAGSSLTRGLVPGSTSDKNKKPMQLAARSVETHVLRNGERNDLERVWCQGAVHVHQEPATPEDKGVDIRGDTLHLTHFPEGSILIVTGNLGQVQLNKITIQGPTVEIDQKANTARVTGNGFMQMLTEKSFQGDKLDKPTELTVHWNKSMFFNGQIAYFEGRVQAEQNSSRLLCEEMQAFLDRPVSFKEGEKGGQSASVRDLVCDKKVRIDDEKRQGNVVVQKMRLISPSVAMNKEDSVLNATGPGILYLLQLGTKGESPLPGSAPAPPPQPGKKEEKELTLTRIEYQLHFDASDKLVSNDKARMANFFGDVDLFNLPTDKLDQAIDPNKLPPGAMHLHCERLQILSQRLPDGGTTQQMEAHKKVTVESQEFWGRADVVKYDEAKQLVILEAADNGVATIHRTQVQAGESSTLKGKKIKYFRKTNVVEVDQGTVIDLGN